ncbi:hypothetical protein M514_17501, partial [Trichuris suis]
CLRRTFIICNCTLVATRLSSACQNPTLSRKAHSWLLRELTFFEFSFHPRNNDDTFESENSQSTQKPESSMLHSCCRQ